MPHLTRNAAVQQDMHTLKDNFNWDSSYISAKVVMKKSSLMEQKTSPAWILTLHNFIQCANECWLRSNLWITTWATDWEELTIGIDIHNSTAGPARPLESWDNCFNCCQNTQECFLEVILNQQEHGSHLLITHSNLQDCFSHSIAPCSRSSFPLTGISVIFSQEYHRQK